MLNDNILHYVYLLAHSSSPFRCYDPEEERQHDCAALTKEDRRSQAALKELAYLKQNEKRYQGRISTVKKKLIVALP